MPPGPMFLVLLALSCILISDFINIYSHASSSDPSGPNSAGDEDSPELQVTFCLEADSTPANCKLSYLYSKHENSALNFGDLRSGTFLHDKTDRPMTATCTASEPLRWILQTDADIPAATMESSINRVVSREVVAYTYRIYFPKPVTGSIRCESYANSSRAAEMYIAKESTDRSYVYEDHLLLPFLVPQKIDAHGVNLTVPCILKGFSLGMDYSNYKVTQTSRQNMLLDSITPACIKCFPRPAVHYTTNCSSCNHFELSWNHWDTEEEEEKSQYDSNNGQTEPLSFLNQSSPLSVTSNNDFLRCATNTDCYVQAVAVTAQNFPTLPCNDPDLVVTCVDAYSTVRNHPASCEAKEVLQQNFRAIEACMMKEMGQKLDNTEYDPRIGFRLKKQPEHDTVVFKCPTTGLKWTSTYLTPYYEDQSSNVNQPQLSYSYEDFSTAAGGRKVRITCKVRKTFKHHDKLDLVLIQCSTLTDCDLKLRRQRGYLIAAKSSSTLGQSKSINFPEWFGRELVMEEFSQGIVLCGFPYSPQPHGVNFDNAVGYFLTGVDQRPHFIMANNLHNEIGHQHKDLLLKLKLDGKYGGVGSVVTILCTVSTFIMFPELQLTLEHADGRRPGEAHPVVRSDNFTLEHKWSFVVHESLTKIHCTAPFRHSPKRLSVSLSVDEMLEVTGSFPPYWIVIIIILAIILVISSALCVVWANVKYRRAKELRELTREEIDEFFNGNKKERTEETAACSGTIDADSIGFPARFHVSAEELKLDLSKKLGEGEFGCCVRGEYRGDMVAVKSTKDTVEVAAFKDFLREVKIMAYIGSHDNIVEFIGAQVSSIDQRICKAVLELSPYGDLLNYLRKSASLQKSMSNTTAGMEANVMYINKAGHPFESDGIDSPLEFRHLCYFCQQIANGMDFLAGKRVIHGDLAARNVLVFPDFRVKVTDFGMSRKLYASANYTKKQATPLPWRWMAIESLKYMEFSTMSDIWSFGVTAWEVFTLGQVPYSGINWSHEFEEQLEHGKRLWRPEGLSEHVYQFMLALWNLVPTARPSFSIAKQFFGGVQHGQDGRGWRGGQSNNIPA